MLDPAFRRLRAPARRCISQPRVGMTQYSDALDKLMRRDLPAADAAPTFWARSSPTPAARSCAWRRRKNIRTSPISSTAAAKQPYAGEDRIMVPSPKVATYDLQPEMSAPRTDRQGGRRDRLRQIRSDRARISPIPTWWAIPASCRPRSRRWRRSMPASAASPTPIESAGRRASGHRRPRQLRDDARSRDRRPAHRPHHQPGAAVAARRAQPRARSPKAASPTSRRRCWS